MNRDDEQAFIRFLSSTGSIAILKSVQGADEVGHVQQLPDLGTPFAGIIWIWNPDISEPPRLQLVKEQGYFVVDGLNSEVVEWSRSSPVEGRLRPGRLWVETTRQSSDDPGLLTRKGAAFAKWASLLMRWIKRHSVRGPDGVYRFPGAVSQGACFGNGR